MDLTSTLNLMLSCLLEIRNLLKINDGQVHQKANINEITKEPLATADSDSGPPETASIEKVFETLKIGRSSFYVHVYNRLLFPVLRLGRRNYYCIQEVYDLLKRHKQKHLPYRKLEPEIVL